MNNAICVLANNMYFFKELIFNLPDNLKNFKFFIFNDTRIGNKTFEIHEIMKGFNYEVITDKDVNELLPIKNNFVYDYSMSLNILMPWYIFSTKKVDKVLFSDEDILYTNKLLKVFNNINNSSFSTLRLQAANDKRLNEKRKDYNILIQICNCIGYNYNKEEWYQKRINSGQFIITKNQFDLKFYEECLIKFFKNSFIYDCWKNRKTHTYGSLDERFLSAFIIKLNIYNIDLNNYTYFCYNNIEKIKDITLINNYNKKAIFHICNTSHKKNTYSRMIKLGLIKGNILEN